MFRWNPQIKNTFDHYYHVCLLRTYAVCYAAIVLPMSLLLSIAAIWGGIFLAVFMLLFLTPFTVYHLLTLRDMHHDPASYQACTAVMVENHPSFARTVYLVLEVTLPNGNVVRTRSASVFSPGVLDRHYYGNLFGKPLRVLYNEESGRLLVRIPEEN